MAHTITVFPELDWWVVRIGGCENDMRFYSGARAEAAARMLGRRLAAAGDRTEIRLQLRDGALAGRFICAPPPEHLALAG
jgi:hypothetical protein